MKRLAALALVFAGIVSPALAFAGAAHGGGGGGGGSVHGSSGHAGFSGSSGFSSRSAPAFHSNFRSAPYRSPGLPRYSGARPFNPTRSYPSGRPGIPGVRPGYGYNRPGQLRYPYSPFRPPYRGGYGFAPYNYGWPGWPGWYGNGFLGYPYLYDNDDFSDYGDSQTPYYDGQNYDVQPQYPDPRYPDQAPYAGPWEPESYPPPRPDYQPSGDSSYPPPSQSPVTLVFKDGRPSQQVYNYILSRDSISVWDQHPREIPLSQIDLAATERVNREAGIDFHLPNPR